MADTLSADELMRRASVPVVKSKGAPLFRARTNAASKAKTMKPKHPDARRKEIEDSNPGLITDFPLLQQQNWDKLSDKDKVVVLDVIGDIKFIEGMDLKEPSMIAEKEKVLSKLKEFLSASSTHIQSLSTYQEFGHKSLEALLEEMDKGLSSGNEEGQVIVPSEEDLQIATILKMAGHDVEFTGGKWIYKEEVAPVVSYGVELDGKRIFSNDNVNALISYLNYEKEAKRDTQHIVPSKLLQVYREVLQQQMTSGDQSKLQMSLTKTFIQEKNQIFSMDSDAYKITRLLDNDTMLRNAQRMALVSSFENAFADAPETTDLTDSMRKSLDTFSVSDSYSRRLKHLDRLISVVDRNGSAFEEMGPQGGYNVDYISQYDEQIRRLEAQDPEGQLLIQVRNAKEAYLKTVTLQQVFWQSRIKEMIANGGNIFGNELATTLNESMGFAVMQNEGGFNMANGDAVKKFFEEHGQSETFEELKAMLGKGSSQQEIVAYLRQKNLISESEYGSAGSSAAPRGANPSGASPTHLGSISPRGTGQPQKNGDSSVKYPEIFLQYLNDVAGVDLEAENNLLLDYSNLRLYQAMWEKDGVFDIGFRALKAEKPEATIDDFIKQFAEQQHIEANFNPELIEDAYYLTHKDGVEQGKLARVQSKLDAFNEQLLISDLMLRLFTPDELSQYSSLEDNDKTALLQVKNKEALKVLEELKKDPKAYDTALDLAKKRHEAGIVGAVIKQKWSNTRTAEQEAGVQPLVSTAIDKFLRSLGKEQKANNQYLIDNGEPVVDNGQPQQEPKQQEAKNGNTLGDTTFGDMYPSGPNVDQFLKRMKPYSAKAVKKNFIDKLLADLDKIKISKDAYYARMSSFTSSRDIFAQEPTEAEKKAIEAQLQQKEQQVLQIKQRDFEASAFIPAAIMFDRVRGGFKGKPEYESADKLRTVFRYLATTDDLSADAKLGVKTPDGKDVRDDLRALALKICGGGFKGKGAEGVQQELAPILTKYGVDPLVQEDIKDAFLFMTPELLAIALEPVSAVRDGKLEIGATIPEHMLNATNDSQRWQSLQVRGFNMAEHEATIEDLSTLVGTIYRTKDGSQIDKKDIDSSFEVQLKHKGSEYDGVEFDQVKDKDHMKAMLQKMRERANATMQGAAPVAEDEGRGIDD